MKTYLDHAFLSYSSKDEEQAWEIVSGLEIRKKSIWFAPNRIGLGDPITIKIERGVDNAKHLIALISPNYLASEWCMMERHTATFSDPTSQERKIIPLLLERCKLPSALKTIKSCDLTEGVTPMALAQIAESLN